MRVIGFVGSPRRGGSTEIIVGQVLAGAAEKGAETELFNLNSLNIKGCQACMHCRTNNVCAVQDDMQHLYDEIKSADAVVIGSPIYMFSVTAQTKTFVDRLFPFLNHDFSSKIRKKTVLVYTQGHSDKNEYKYALDSTTSALSLLGFRAKKIIIEGDLDHKSNISQNHEAMENAKQIGIGLAKSIMKKP